MSAKATGGFEQGRSLNRPPLFCGNNFAHWRALMKMYLIDQDLALWQIIETGPYIITTPGPNGGTVEKNPKDYSADDLEKSSKNYKAINALYCALDNNEFNRVRSCKTAKEIWDKLIVTYEGTSQVKQTKININLRKYELFKMEANESIKEMFTRFTEIINNLDSLGKTFTTEENVRKILRSLPKAKWEPKVTAIEEAQDLTVLELDDLQGKLLTHELLMNDSDGEKTESSKNLALKAKREDTDSDSDDEDPFALISKGLARILKMKKQFGKDYNRGKYNSYKDKSYKKDKDYKGKSSNSSNKSKTLTCFECGDPDHLVKDCPQKKNKKHDKEKDKDYEKKKHAMVASSWSDSDSSDSDSDDQANLCLMANHQENDDKNEHLEVIVRNLMSSPPEVLSDFITNAIINEENYILQVDKLKRELHEKVKYSSDLLSENQVLESSKSALDVKIKALESTIKGLETKTKGLETLNSTLDDELSSLHHFKNEAEKQQVLLAEKIKELKENLIKFTKSEETLDCMLGGQKASLNKHGIGYFPKFPQKAKTTFVKAGTYKSFNCFHCGKSGHKRVTRPYRRNESHIMRNTFPYQLRGKIKQIWVRKGVRPPNMVRWSLCLD